MNLDKKMILIRILTQIEEFISDFKQEVPENKKIQELVVELESTVSSLLEQVDNY